MVIALINKNSSVPMYEQIAALLKEEIFDKKYGPNGSIGTHKELAARFDVSLITIRKAIKLLTQQGLVEVAQGKGTFAKSTILHDHLTRLTGVENIISESHLSAKAEVSSFEIIDTPYCFDTELKKGLGKKCLHIERIHVMEGIKVAYAEIYLPVKYGEYLTKADVEQNTIYQLYEKKWNMVLGKGQQIIRADAASSKAAKALDIVEGHPVLSIKRRAFNAAGELVEYMLLIYEHTQYSFEIELQLSSR